MRAICAVRLSVAPHIQNLQQIRSLTRRSETNVGGASPSWGEARTRFRSRPQKKTMNPKKERMKRFCIASTIFPLKSYIAKNERKTV